MLVRSFSTRSWPPASASSRAAPPHSGPGGFQTREPCTPQSWIAAGAAAASAAPPVPPLPVPPPCPPLSVPSWPQKASSLQEHITSQMEELARMPEVRSLTSPYSFLRVPEFVARKLWHITGPLSPGATGCSGCDMLVRRCYEPLFNKIWMHNYAGLEQRGSLFIGNTGIGKTGFLMYCLRRLLQEKVDVILKLPSSTSYLCLVHPQQTWQSFSVVETAKTADAIAAVRPGAWYIGDEALPKVDLDLEGFKFLVATTPKGVAGEFSEFAEHPGVAMLYYPLWSLEELLALNGHDKVRLGHHEDVVKSMYGHWGGVPRYVLSKKDLTALLDEAVELVQGSDDLVSATNLPEKLLKVFHLVPSENFESARLEFASPYVESRVYLQIPPNKLNHYLRMPVSSTMENIQGRLFREHLIRELFPKGGELKSRDLGTDGKFESLVKTEVLPRSDDPTSFLVPPADIKAPCDFIYKNHIYVTSVLTKMGLAVSPELDVIVKSVKEKYPDTPLELRFIVPTEKALDTFSVDWVLGEEQQNFEKMEVVKEMKLAKLNEWTVKVKVVTLQKGSPSILKSDTDLTDAATSGSDSTQADSE